jgi:hypothetical protein
VNNRKASSALIPDNQEGFAGRVNYHRRIEYHDTPITGSMAWITIDNFGAFAFVASNSKTVQTAPNGGDFIFIDSNYFSQVVSFARAPGRIADTFRELADAWYVELENDAFSSLTKITSGSKNYLKIIALGSEAVPLILRELESNCAPWFLALQVLTGNSEVGKEHAGNFGKIADDWIRWGEKNGYLTEQALSI